MVISLELLFSCKYNLLWLQKSLTSGDLIWEGSCPSYVQSPWYFFRIPGLSSLQLLDQQCFQMSLIACLPGQQLSAFPTTGCDYYRDCRTLQWTSLPSLWLTDPTPNLTDHFVASGSLIETLWLGVALRMWLNPCDRRKERHTHQSYRSTSGTLSCEIQPVKQLTCHPSARPRPAQPN